jgi:hypothetical protein
MFFPKIEKSKFYLLKNISIIYHGTFSYLF